MPFLDVPPIAFAHRGYARGGDENSMTAFQRAVDLGYHYVETDVRATRDGVALAFHDARLERVTDGRGSVDALPWSAVSQARIAGREPIPLLRDVLGTWPQVRFNLDVKSRDGIAPTISAVIAAGAADRVCLTAFSDRRVAALRRALPQGASGLGPGEALAVRLAAVRGRAVRAQPGRCLQVPPRLGPLGLVDARLVKTAHAAGLAVHVWTVNDRAEMGRLLDLGVDGLMSDDAPLLRDVLTGRGQWVGR